MEEIEGGSVAEEACNYVRIAVSKFDPVKRCIRGFPELSRQGLQLREARDFVIPQKEGEMFQTLEMSKFDHSVP
jgi:hypothetical protein